MNSDLRARCEAIVVESGYRTYCTRVASDKMLGPVREFGTAKEYLVCRSCLARAYEYNGEPIEWQY